MANYAEEFNAIFLYLNQMRLKPGVVYGDPRTTPGGKAMEYYASGRLALGRSKIMEGTGADKEFVGQKIAVQCVKSKFTKPFQETEMRLMFDEDDVLFFDMITSSIEALIRREKLKYSKPRVTWTDGKQYFVKALVEKIRAEGLAHELQALWA
jgi:RecA/RadA recombinase